MKHTFVFIDKLIMLLNYAPSSLDTEEDITKAKNMTALIHGYIHTLKKLINAHKNKKYLDRLHKINTAEIGPSKAQVTLIEDWADKVA